MIITPQMLDSVPFQYAQAVRDGNLHVGKRIKQAVARFYEWIDQADDAGYYLDHDAGMRILRFFPEFLNHTKGKMAGKPFHLQPFQQFTLYIIFAWKRKSDGLRRIRSVYDKRAKKNGKSAEMAGLALYCLSFALEMEAEVYVGATKEEQAKICWNQAKMFIESPVANPKLRKMGFYAQQKIVGFRRTSSIMRPLGGDSTTQDGINSFLAIIDEYHAHKDDSVKENLESSAVQRAEPIVYHITTAGTNVQSACARCEERVVEVLEGRMIVDHLWIMIHDLDEGDDWEDETKWIKANPLLGNGLDIERIREEFINAKAQASKIANFKTKHLNMWVDAPQIWIANEIWMLGKVDEIPLEKFAKFGSFAGLDLSTTTDISAFVAISEPDENDDRYIVPFFFCPKYTIDKRSKEDRVPYRYWMEQGWLTATPGNVIDYQYIEDCIKANNQKLNIQRIECDPWNATQIIQRLDESGISISEFGQSIGSISAPTKEFEKLVLSEKLKHDGNPILSYMLAGCQIYYDANGNMKVIKGKSRVTRRIDGIIAAINAIAGSMSPEEDLGKYSKPQSDIYI